MPHPQLEALLPGFGRNRPLGETDNVEAVSRMKVTGDLVESLQVIEGAAGAIDLPKLAALK